MEEHHQFEHNACSSFTPASTESTRNGEYSGVSSTYSTNSQIVGEEANEGNTNRERHPDSELLHHGSSVSYNARSTVTEGDQAMAMGIIGRIREESWSCVVIIFTFWFLASIATILRVYGSSKLLLGPNSSILIKTNPYFVEYVKIEELYKSADGPTLYGFYKDPTLDVVITWSDTHDATLQSSNHRAWIYFLNEGSQINISYTVNSTSSSSVVLVIVQGYEGLSQWLEDPSYPNTTLSWQVIQGNGLIHQDILTSSSYYVAMRNLNDEAAVVQLNMRLRTLLYNTSGAYEKCCFAQDECSIKLSFNGGNTALLTSPGSTPGREKNEWYVKLSYGPRWITYFAGIGGTTLLVLAAIHFLRYCVRQEGSGTHHFGETRSERRPLRQNKDDDLSSWGSSYDSVSQDDEEPEDPQAQGLLEEKPTKDGENNTRRLCAICFDAPRDCFFLPCGHCVACFACGTRIAEAAGICPICRRQTKKVRKIFTV